jgi:hypothetical protein
VIVLFSAASRPILGPNQPSVQWVPPGLFPWGLNFRGVKLTTHLNLVPRLRMSGAIPPLPLHEVVVK